MKIKEFLDTKVKGFHHEEFNPPKKTRDITGGGQMIEWTDEYKSPDGSIRWIRFKRKAGAEIAEGMTAANEKFEHFPLEL